MKTELKDLIGRKVNKIFINKDFLMFETDKGDLIYAVTGDCCSSSYFYDFYGVKALLKNGPVTEVKTVELLPSDVACTNGDSSDVVQVYGYQITTECEHYGERTSVFSFRNSSNGYYGGSINLAYPLNEEQWDRTWGTKLEKKEGTGAMVEVTDDIVEVN